MSASMFAEEPTPGNLEFLGVNGGTAEVVLFPEKILVSCVTKSKGPLTKIMREDPETKQLVKDTTECSLSNGSISQIPISSPTGFARMLRTRTTSQAIVHGVSQYKDAKVVKKGKEGSYPKNGTPVIARTKEYISYSDGPGVMLFDHDKARALSVGSVQALVTASKTSSNSPAPLVISACSMVHRVRSLL